MKALSVKNPWASMIASGQKTIETRKWKIHYRGNILICSSKTFDKSLKDWKLRQEGYLMGYALCTVQLYHVVPMNKLHEIRACCRMYDGAYAWCLRNLRRITPFKVKGSLGVFNVEIPLGVRMVK